METSVVDVHVRSLRPAYENLREWEKEPNHVYVGRRGVVFIDKVRYPAHDSPWANPFKVGRDGSLKEVVDKYRIYISNRLEAEPELYDALLELRGKKLGCWCYPNLCHANVLCELIANGVKKCRGR